MHDMVVIQFGDRTVKGFSDKTLWSTEWQDGPAAMTPPIRLLDSNTTAEIPLDGVKAVFFVKSFEGKSHQDLSFHDHLQPMECLWVRVGFHDGEVVEGIVCNGFEFVLHDGFFMSPIDPEGNNLLVYVFKRQLKNFEVLGMRPAPKNHFDPRRRTPVSAC